MLKVISMLVLLLALCAVLVVAGDPGNDEIEIPDLGRGLRIGHLYDARNDQVVPGNLWGAQDIQDSTEVSKWVLPTGNVYSLTFGSSDQTKRDQMGVSGEIALSLACLPVKVSGSAKVVTDKRNVYKTATANFIFQTGFFKETLYNVGAEGFLKPSMAAINSKLATHVVTAVWWGVTCAATFDKTYDHYNETTGVDGQLTLTMQAFIAKVQGDAGVDIKQFESFYNSRFSIHFNCDLVFDEVVPTDLESAITYFQNLGKKFIPLDECVGNKVKPECFSVPVPKKAKLYPLAKLNTGAARLASMVDTAVLSSTTKMMTALSDNQKIIADTVAQEPCEPFPIWKENLTNYLNNLTDYFLGTQKRVADALLQIRNGTKMTSEALKEIVIDYDISNYRQQVCDRWKTQQVMQIVALMSSLNVLSEHVKVTTQPSDFEVLRGNASLRNFFVFVLYGFQPQVRNGLMGKFASFAKATAGNQNGFLFVHYDSFGRYLPSIPKHEGNYATVLQFQHLSLVNHDFAVPTAPSAVSWGENPVSKDSSSFTLTWDALSKEKGGGTRDWPENIAAYKIFAFQKAAIEPLNVDLRTHHSWDTTLTTRSNTNDFVQCKPYRFQIRALTEFDGEMPDNVFTRPAYLNVDVDVTLLEPVPRSFYLPGDKIQISVRNSSQRPKDCNLVSDQPWKITVGGRPCEQIQVEGPSRSTGALEVAFCLLPKDNDKEKLRGPVKVHVLMALDSQEDIAYPEALATINVGKTHASPTSVPSVTTIRNVGTELEKPSQVVMGFSETSETVRMFDESDGKGSQWWVLMPVEGKQDKYYIVAAIAGKQMYLADSRNSKNRVILKEADDDASFRLWWTVTRTSHDGWYSIQDERGWYLSVPGIGSYVDVHHTDDKTGHQHWLLPEWSPVGYTCKFDLDYANNDLGPEVPHQDIFSDQTCADKCDFTAKCQGFVMVPSNPYGGTPGCYLKFKMGNVRSMPGWKSCKSDATLFF